MTINNMIMLDPASSTLINSNPIGDGLRAFRDQYHSICRDRNVPDSSETLIQLDLEDLRNLTLLLLLSLRSLPAAGLLFSETGRNTLRDVLLTLISAVASNGFDFDRVRPLLRAALASEPQDSLIWNRVSAAAVESTPPPRSIAKPADETPWSQNTSALVNSSEYRQDVDKVLKEELDHLYVGLPNFCEKFFEGVPDLKGTSETVFLRCTKGNNPLFKKEGWRGWPVSAKESDVLAWFEGLIPELKAFMDDLVLAPVPQRKLLVQPKIPLQGSTAKRSMDIGFVNSSEVINGPESRYHWSQIMVPGELKSNPAADKASIAWIDLATYAREVLAAQYTRRFVLGFTLCGSYMRIWEFDRVGGIASEAFDINSKDGGLKFVTAILGFLCMNEEGLGFDPTIVTSGGEEYINIKRDGQMERLILDKVMNRARCIVGRATTCWKAHRKEDPLTSYVIKDSWQYTDRDEEGELLKEATAKGVINMSRYYHHETVRVHDADDDIQNNIRKGLDITKATNYRPFRSKRPSSISFPSISSKGRNSSAGVKRASSNTDAALPPSKRSCPTPPIEAAINKQLNRVRRRVIVRDYGRPIYEASSRIALLSAFKDCIAGHESLIKAGLLHRDISINNIMINEDDKNPSWRAFLIDLDLAVRDQREGASGAKGKTGTRAFMAIGALQGHRHSFMHDLESFFWVLFWICIHYSGPGISIGPTEFDTWNYESDNRLVMSKMGAISDEDYFLSAAEANFTPYYQPLIPWVNRLRKEVFPNDQKWKGEDRDLYSKMMVVLEAAREEEMKVSGS
ncbi:serine/threonine-protein kinase Sgk2 [Trichoderma ceciliae]